MTKGVYAVYDRKAQIYLTQSFIISHNDVQPIRVFTDATNDPNSFLAAHKLEFDLHQIADFNDMTGDIAPQLRIVITGHDLDKPD